MILTEECHDLPSWYQTTVPCLVKNASVVASAAAVVAAAPSFRFAARHSIGVATWEFVARAVHRNNWKKFSKNSRGWKSSCIKIPTTPPFYRYPLIPRGIVYSRLNGIKIRDSATLVTKCFMFRHHCWYSIRKYILKILTVQVCVSSTLCKFVYTQWTCSVFNIVVYQCCCDIKKVKFAALRLSEEDRNNWKH